MWTIQTSKTYLINQIYQIISIYNKTPFYFYLFFIFLYAALFIGFMSIYHVITVDIVSSYMIFSYLYLRFVDLL